ncbi:transposase [Anthocerotibacter panamensis]|uniref:transposase n=1 Tax=Anthocerotibacter panamensis TaxID=2857077 RepID=UPI001C407DC0|nr:transposase [Anthocerotibacter panamensis]
MKAGRAVVLTLDECHLNWGDMKGYVWGKVGEKAQIPIVNDRERQTYYGALNCVSGRFHITPSKKGDSQETIHFIKYLQKEYPGIKLKLFWDGASYHDSEDIRNFLSEENKGLERKDWKVECIQFAPYAPEQNPTEDIWRCGKKFIRECWHLCKSFVAVKFIFEWGLKHEIFDFPKVREYRKMLQLT